MVWEGRGPFNNFLTKDLFRYADCMAVPDQQYIEFYLKINMEDDVPLVAWNDSYSVRVREIDRQHQMLVTMINDLNDAMKQGKGKDVLGKIVSGLTSYTATHFKTEEKYFDRFKYPDADSHKKEHTAFVKKVSDFKKGFEEGKLMLTVDVMNFLSDWLLKHIKGADKKYSQLFVDNGLQ